MLFHLKSCFKFHSFSGKISELSRLDQIIVLSADIKPAEFVNLTGQDLMPAFAVLFPSCMDL